MFRGFYTVASGMIAQQRRTELLTNNMANANTPGYKSDQSVIRSFPEMLMSRVGKDKLPLENPIYRKNIATLGPLGAGVYMQETLPQFTQGSVYETEIPTDIAMMQVTAPINENGNEGAVFYRLQHPVDGEYYTRNGNFTLDGQGYLVNPQGLYVLSETGERILLPSDDFKLTDDGRIYVNDAEIARLGVAFSPNPETLRKEQNGLYRTADDANLGTAYGVDGLSFTMQQGFIEGSNVDSAKTMTDMLTAYRAFEANQKILQAYDKSMEKAVNEIGRV